MAKSLRELTSELKDFILSELRDPRSGTSMVKPYEYNSLLIKMDSSVEHEPHIIVSLRMSEVIYLIKTGKKTIGSLGRDEQYIFKWLSRGITRQKLLETWAEVESKNILGKDQIIEGTDDTQTGRRKKERKKERGDNNSF